MQINVAQLLKATIGTTRDYEIDGAVDITGDGVERQVKGEVTLTRTNRGILVQGTLHTELEYTCSRCLAPFTLPLTFTVQDEYFPAIDVSTGVPVCLPDEPGCFTIDEHHIIDLTEAIRQYAILAIPMKLLCREDCAGLCPTCGRNLNQGACGCPTQETDPRWAKLVKLAEQKGTE
ncbi:MAG: DUF177 domain-containing protein [Chloroflexota bacterium]|nr:DUF177 domain-containing protein [Chloroflexota bacterium]